MCLDPGETTSQVFFDFPFDVTQPMLNVFGIGRLRIDEPPCRAPSGLLQGMSQQVKTSPALASSTSVASEF